MPMEALKRELPASRRRATTPTRRRVALVKKSPEVSVPILWKVCCRREMPIRERADGWHQVIKNIVTKKREAKAPGWGRVTVHDAACGTGELMEALHKMGVPMSGSDMSLEMLLHQYVMSGEAMRDGEEFHDRPVVVRKSWTKLAGYFDDLETRKGPNAKPSILIVPGSSIPYAGVWDKNRPATRNSAVRENEILVALHSFKESLRPGGVLILTTTPDSSFRHIRKNRSQVEEYDAEIYGKPVTIKERITHDEKRNLRNWRTTIQFEGFEDKQVLERNAFLLPRSKLIKMLRDLGFTNVRKIKIPGEPYDGVIAETPPPNLRKFAHFQF